VQFEFTEEQRMIRGMMAEFASDHGDSARVRKAMASGNGYDRETWRAMCSELALPGMLIGAELGGLALGPVEMALTFEELGRFIVPSPLLATGVLGATLLAGLDEPSARECLGRVAEGQTRVAVAWSRPGEATRVLGAQTADLLLLHESGEDDGGTVYLVPADGPGRFAGVEVTPLTMMDQTRPMASVAVCDSAALAGFAVADTDAAERAAHAALQFGRMAVAAEAIGAARECLDRTVRYAEERVQFGRAIGSFQAVKHQLADMMVSVEAAVSAVYYAATAAAEEPERLEQMAALARVQASEALSLCAGKMIQLHGGIGFTWEHDAHLYFKRARGTATLFGTNAQLDEIIAAGIGLGDAGAAA
jgi:alkylation response protein AidB-like acyl-CoA dehydrogenase